MSTTHTYHDTYKHVTWIAGVPSSQALPGFLITAPPSVCVPTVISAQAVWIENQKIKSKLVVFRISDISDLFLCFPQSFLFFQIWGNMLRSQLWAHQLLTTTSHSTTLYRLLLAHYHLPLNSRLIEELRNYFSLNIRFQGLITHLEASHAESHFFISECESPTLALYQQ